MRRDEPDSFGEGSDRTVGGREDPEESACEQKDSEARPFLENPIPRSSRRGRWFLASPPEDADESQLRA